MFLSFHAAVRGGACKTAHRITNVDGSGLDRLGMSI